MGGVWLVDIAETGKDQIIGVVFFGMLLSLL